MAMMRASPTIPSVKSLSILRSSHIALLIQSEPVDPGVSLLGRAGVLLRLAHLCERALSAQWSRSPHCPVGGWGKRPRPSSKVAGEAASIISLSSDTSAAA